MRATSGDAVHCNTADHEFNALTDRTDPPVADAGTGDPRAPAITAPATSVVATARRSRLPKAGAGGGRAGLGTAGRGMSAGGMATGSVPPMSRVRPRRSAARLPPRLPPVRDRSTTRAAALPGDPATTLPVFARRAEIRQVRA